MVVQAAIKLGTRGAKAAGGAATGGGLGDLLEKILRTLKPLADLLGLIVSVLLFKILKAIDKLAPIENILGKIFDFFGGLFDFGVWLGENLADFIMGLFDIGEWLGKKFKDYLTGKFKINTWLAEKFVNYIDGKFNIAEWLVDKFIGFFSITKFDIAAWIARHIAGWFGRGGGGGGGGGGLDITGRTFEDIVDRPYGEFSRANNATTINFNGLTYPEAKEQLSREFGVSSFNQGRF